MLRRLARRQPWDSCHGCLACASVLQAASFVAGDIAFSAGRARWGRIGRLYNITTPSVYH